MTTLETADFAHDGVGGFLFLFCAGDGGRFLGGAVAAAGGGDGIAGGVGAGGAQLWDVDYVVPDRRRSLYGLYGDCGAGGAVWRGANGFFAVPYAVIAYPYMMMVLPRLWKVCHRHGYITFADFVARAVWESLADGGDCADRDSGADAVYRAAAGGDAGGDRGDASGRIGCDVAGLPVNEWALVAAFVILAAYTYSSGLRAPAVIAIVKDIMLYGMVLAALVIAAVEAGRICACV